MKAVAFASVVAAALVLAASAHAAGTLTVCTEGSPEGFDAAQYESVITAEAAAQPLYDQLVQFKPGTTELVPGIAASWDVSADGLVYTFHLRSDASFHATAWFKPTRTANADDVLFSLDRINDAAHPFHGIAKGGYIYWDGMQMRTLIRSVAKLDERTVRITLTRPEAPFLADLAIPAIGSIYSAEYADQLLKAKRLDAFNTQPIGTGPFVFQSYQKDAVVRFAANPTYWGGVPKIDKLIFAVTPDDDTRLQRVRAGECLVAKGIRQSSAVSMKADANPALVPVSVLRTSHLSLNVKRPWLSDVRFREALRLAIDRRNLVQSVYAGFAEPAKSFLPPAVWSHDESLVEPHDVERARALVKASGYDGSELKLVLAIGRGTRDGEVMQGDLARAGVKVKVEQLEIAELLKRAGRGDFDMAFISWYGDNGDPDNFFTPNLSCGAIAGGGNKSQWCDAAFDAILDRARRSTDKAARTALYVEAQRRMHDAVPLIPLAYPLLLNVVNRRVHGVVTTPFGMNDFRNVRID